MYTQNRTELLQSPLWGAVQEVDGRKIFYIDSRLLIKHELPFKKSWLYSPRPTILDEQQLKMLLLSVAEIAKREKAVFWKIEGVKIKCQMSTQNPESFRGWVKCQIASPIQYPETFVLGLSKTEEELLNKMKSKTRYNIRLAQKKGVTTRWSKDVNYIPLFHALLKQTAARQAIRIHAQSHYRHILHILGEKDAAALIIAESKEKIPIAANLVAFFGDTATYLHGGTDHANRNLMAPYLLQWKTMQEAKRRGLRWYDLGGCAVTKGRVKKWAGITRFKKGFGGELTAKGETYDVVFSREWYWLYKQGNRLKTLIN